MYPSQRSCSNAHLRLLGRCCHWLIPVLASAVGYPLTPITVKQQLHVPQASGPTGSANNVTVHLSPVGQCTCENGTIRLEAIEITRAAHAMIDSDYPI